MDESETKVINFDDINYAIYKIGNWDNTYEINQIGLSNEIPVTESTVHHVKTTMIEIRKSAFDVGTLTVNGFVAIAMQLNPKLQDRELEDLIKLEEKEYDSILEELDNLELLPNDGSIELETDEYLIYKLEKECHVVNSIPYNDFTKKHYIDEIKKIEDSLN